MVRRLLASTVLVLGLGTASAQDVTIRMAPRTPAGQADQVRLNVAVNFFVPGPSGVSDQALDAQEKARRAIYQMAVHECAVLLDTIARECHMEGLNVNVSRHQGQMPEGFQVGANMNFRILLK